MIREDIEIELIFKQVPWVINIQSRFPLVKVKFIWWGRLPIIKQILLSQLNFMINSCRISECKVIYDDFLGQ